MAPRQGGWSIEARPDVAAMCNGGIADFGPCHRILYSSEMGWTAPMLKGSCMRRSSSNPRVAIIGSRGYPSTYGGFETLVRRLVPHLVEKGVAVDVYSRGDTPRGVVAADQVRSIRTPGISSRSLSTLTHGLTSSIHAAASRPHAALVLNVANGYWLPGLKAAGVPTAVNVDGLEWERAKWNAVGKSIFRGGARATARWADCLVSDSVAIQAHWKQHFERTSVFIPYGADISTRSGDGPLGLPSRRFVLAVARLVPENNVELLLDALTYIDESYPIVVVGSSGAPSEIEARLRALDASGRVRWLGHVADQDLLLRLWQHAGVYVHGHSVGGTNPALLQALGAGAPTLALDTVYNAEVVGSGAWNLYSHDAVLLAEKITALVSDAVLQDQVSAAGQNVVRGRYSWDAVLQAYYQVLVGMASPS